jgi:hypothetical protein
MVTKAMKTREDNEQIREVVMKFLSALEKGKDFRPFAQVSMRRSLLIPIVPAFEGSKILGIRPHHGNPEVFRMVDLELILWGSPGQARDPYRMSCSVVKEDENGAPSADGAWGVVTTSFQPEKGPSK